LYISTIFIVKNEISNLKHIVDKVLLFSDEVVFVDTGSSDGTVEYLKDRASADNSIIFATYNWDNNFSNARNAAIDLCSKDFILWLDADDRIDDDNISQIIHHKSSLNLNLAYFIKVNNSSDDTFFYQIRIFPNIKPIKFIYPVHEQLDMPTHIRKAFLDIEILHTGYENRDNLKEKHLRNIAILKSYNSQDFYFSLQMGESYKIIGDYDKAVEYLNYALLDKNIVTLNREIMGFIYLELYKLYSILGFHDRAINALYKGEEFAGDFPVLYYYFAKELYEKGDLDMAIKYYSIFLSEHCNKKYINPVSHKLEDSGIYSLAKCFFQIGQYEKAVMLFNKLIVKYPDHKIYSDFGEKCLEKIF